MIYLTTGANGAGKTLNTLKAVRDKQVAEGRTVYYNGFAMKPEKAKEFGWLEFDPKKWQELPDGAILICDECQNEFPVRASSEKLPEYVRGLSEHRRRGFDFYMISQHPQNIDMFVRRLIGSPGYHRHLKRSFGANMVSVLEWSAVNGNCEKDGSGKNARVSMVPYPKEVYDWYDSASLHTAKKSIPKQVYVLGLLAIIIPVMFWMAFNKMFDKVPPPAAPAAVAASAPGQTPGVTRAGATVQTPAEYLASFAPRIDGLPQTASRYDEVTKPTTAPFPAACVQMGARCNCYTQQGTKLQTAAELCLQIVKNGFFMDWTPTAGQSNQPPQAVPSAQQPEQKLTGGNIPDTPPPAVLTRNDLPSPDADLVRFAHRKPL